MFDVCAECDMEFPGNITHGRCPGCGAKLHPNAKRTALVGAVPLADVQTVGSV